MTLPVELTIAGNVGDRQYWKSCKKKIDALPKNISCHMVGAIPNQKVAALFARHHVFFFPSLGENFGHVIFESLSAGRPVLISDKTPWSDLEVRKAGWAIQLDQPEKFISTIHQLVQMDQSEYNKWSVNALNYAKSYLIEHNFLAQYQMLFNKNHPQTAKAKLV